MSNSEHLPNSSVQVQGLSKSYSCGLLKKISKQVLGSITLEVVPGEILCVLGRNGTGKTTFFKILGGILSPDQGTVQIGGKSPKQCLVGYVAQENPVFPWLRAIDDIGLPLKIAGIKKKQRRQIVRGIVSRFQFQVPLEEYSYALSGGQRQLVNLCRALATPRPPDVIILDEPFASLDLPRRLEFANYLHEIRTQLNIPILLSTHQIELAVLSADYIALFQGNPVRIEPNDLIAVDLPSSRSVDIMRSSEFLDQVRDVETRL